ncbi:hypothetical protein V2J09_002785 [Rumex salicifolius]
MLFCIQISSLIHILNLQRSMWIEGILAFIVGSLIWVHHILKPPASKICGTPNGPPVTSTRIRLRDGRYLAYKARGSPKETSRFKVILSHGFHASKETDIPLSDEWLQKMGIYLVTFDRPGYSESDPNPKRLAGVAFVVPLVNYWWPSLPVEMCNEAYGKLPIMERMRVLALNYAPNVAWLLHKWFPVAPIDVSFQDNPGASFNESDIQIMKRLSTSHAPDKEKIVQQGVYESEHRDMLMLHGKWELDPLQLSYPFDVDSQVMVHLWIGKQDKIISPELQRQIAKKLPWICCHEVDDMGNISGHGRCSNAIDDPVINSPRIKLLDGRLLAYKEIGVSKEEAKFRIIIAHGFGSSKNMNFLAPQGLLESLKIYMLLYDRAGYGESDPNPKRSVKSEAQDIEELADQLNLGSKFYVIGVSMGSYPIWSCLHYIPHRQISTTLAEIHVSTLKSITKSMLLGVALVAPAVNYRWPSLPPALTKDDFRKKLMKMAFWLLKRTPRLLFWWMTQKVFPSANVMEKNPVFFNAKDQENKLENKSVFENLRGDFMVGYGKWEFDPLKLQNPFTEKDICVQLWAGYEDRVVPVQLQRFMSQKLSWMKLHEVPNGGHFIVHDSQVCESVLRSLLLDEEIESA